MASLALPGVFSGIDSESIISKLVAVDNQSLAPLSTRKSTWTAKQAAITDIAKRLGDLKSNLNSLRDSASLRSVTGSSSNTSVVTADSTSGAMLGTHQIEVDAVASSDRLVNGGLAQGDSLVGAGQFVYSYNGATRTVLTTATTKLSDMVSLINNDGSNPGVTASVLDYDVTGQAGKRYHLVLAGNDSGADYGISIEAGTTLAGFGPGSDWTETQTASNSRFRVNGYPANDWIERSGNTVTDVIPNVTLTLQGAGTSTVSLTRSTSGLQQNLGNLVNIYNGIVTQLAGYTGYNEQTKVGGVLQGDSSLYNLVGQIRSVLTGLLPGFQDGQDSYLQAAQLGIEIDKNGNLSLDQDVLNQALADHYYDVLDTIGASRIGSSDNSYVQFTDCADTTVAGQYDVQVDFDSGGAITAARMKPKGADTWQDASVNGNLIMGPSGTDESSLQLTVAWDGVSASQSAVVNVRKGFAGAAYDLVSEMLTPVSGAIPLKQAEYDTAIQQANDQITAQQTRIDKQTQVWRDQFSRLEATLSKLDSMRAAYSALFNSGSSSSSSGA